jgi:hypothetical protein
VELQQHCKGTFLESSLDPPVLFRAAMAASYVFLLDTIAPSALLIRLLSASIDSIWRQQQQQQQQQRKNVWKRKRQLQSLPAGQWQYVPLPCHTAHAHPIVARQCVQLH